MMDISKTEHSPTPMRVGLNFSPTLKVFLTQKERRITLYMYGIRQETFEKAHVQGGIQ